MVKKYLQFDEYIKESEIKSDEDKTIPKSFENDVKTLMDWILNIDDSIKYKVLDKDKRKIKIETDEMTLAYDILKKINNDKNKYSIKSSEIEDYNDLVVIFKSPEEEKEEEKEIEKNRKEKEKDKDMLMGLPTDDISMADGSYGKDEIQA